MTTLAQQAADSAAEILAGMTPTELLTELESAVTRWCFATSTKDFRVALAEVDVLRAEVLNRIEHGTPPF